MELEGWMKDIMARDSLDYICLISKIANTLYPEIYSANERELKLMEIPEMRRLAGICRDRYEKWNYLRDLIKSFDEGKEMNDRITNERMAEAVAVADTLTNQPNAVNETVFFAPEVKVVGFVQDTETPGEEITLTSGDVTE